MLTRDEALDLLSQNDPEKSMLQHSLASEVVMQALAKHFGEDEQLWAMTGLLHDVDYAHTKEAPEKHGMVAIEILAGKLPDEALHAIKAHNSEYTGEAPSTKLDYALRAGETITGLVTAAALMRPTGIDGMEVKSLKKKLKDKAFAASVSRENIRECEQAGIELGDFLALAIAAMTPVLKNECN